jgi:S-adenosylmethionine uptake transporter
MRMVAASFMFAVMSACVVLAKKVDPDLDPFFASFFRVAINLGLIVAVSLITRRKEGIRTLFGDGRWSLWMRGIFGTLSLVCVFYAVLNIGMAETSFLNSSHAIWMALLAPFFLKQANSVLTWVAIVIGFVGMVLILFPSGVARQFSLDLGHIVAGASGLFTACAYMMVARSGRSNHPLTVVFYFTFVATLLHGAYFLVAKTSWNHSWLTLLWLTGAGVAATIAQMFMTQAYQGGSAAMISAAAYSGAVFSLLIGFLLFGDLPTWSQICGGALICVAGVVLPFLVVKNPKVSPITSVS